MYQASVRPDRTRVTTAAWSAHGQSRWTYAARRQSCFAATAIPYTLYRFRAQPAMHPQALGPGCSGAQAPQQCRATGAGCCRALRWAGPSSSAAHLQGDELRVHMCHLVCRVPQCVGVTLSHVQHAADLRHGVRLLAPRCHHVQPQQPLLRGVQVQQQRSLPAARVRLRGMGHSGMLWSPRWREVQQDSACRGGWGRRAQMAIHEPLGADTCVNGQRRYLSASDWRGIDAARSWSPATAASTVASRTVRMSTSRNDDISASEPMVHEWLCAQTLGYTNIVAVVLAIRRLKLLTLELLSLLQNAILHICLHLTESSVAA